MRIVGRRHRFLGERGRKNRPGADEAVWQLASTGLICVVADRIRAGSSLLTVAVDKLEEHLAELAEREIPRQIDTLPGGVRRLSSATRTAGCVSTFGRRFGSG